MAEIRRPTATASQRQNGPPAGVVDIFCGVGGLSHGFALEGFDVRAGIDVDASCRHAYERNNKARFLDWDVESATGGDVARLFVDGAPRVLVGCAPCQPFSTYNRSRTGTRWRLLQTFERLVGEVLPDVVSMENVPRLTTFQGGRLFADFVGMLEESEYRVWWDVVDCAAYGVPQTRRRLVLLASRIGPIELTAPARAPQGGATVRQTIAHLPPIPAGGQHADDPLHRASRLSATNLARIRAARPGTTWKDWAPSLVAACHRRHSGRFYGSVYGRMCWDEPAPTITTQCNGFGNGRFGHPEQDRAISLREAALLQTFPPDYEFFAPGQPWSLSAVARWIGNAVPVTLAQAVARSVRAALAEREGNSSHAAFSRGARGEPSTGEHEGTPLAEPSAGEHEGDPPRINTKESSRA